MLEWFLLYCSTSFQRHSSPPLPTVGVNSPPDRLLLSNWASSPHFVFTTVVWTICLKSPPLFRACIPVWLSVCKTQMVIVFAGNMYLENYAVLWRNNCFKKRKQLEMVIRSVPVTASLILEQPKWAGLISYIVPNNSTFCGITLSAHVPLIVALSQWQFSFLHHITNVGAPLLGLLALHTPSWIPSCQRDARPY